MHINILGIRGIPAAHGGFETFAAKLAVYLRDKGHTVTVYCQDDEGKPGPWIDSWESIRRIHFCPKKKGPLGTIEFDFACVRDVIKQPGIDLVLGYNTAVFNVIQRLKGRKVIMNMDGIEWKREKWSFAAKTWFYINELIGANFCNIAIADHPDIAKHVKKRCFKTPVMIPYGSDVILDADESSVTDLDLVSDQYFLSIARIEPENSILELVSAFSKLDTSFKLVVLGSFIDGNAYHDSVKNAAGNNVVFPGAIYDSRVVSALRFHARAYLHGHQVGGTNPSLVEAMGAGNLVIAHNNKFNRWVTKDSQLYFSSADELINCLRLAIDSNEIVLSARRKSRAIHEANFTWDLILSEYENILREIY